MRINLNKKSFTRSERRFYELLKKYRISFEVHVIIKGREIDFLVGRYAIDIDCHFQDGEKNEMLVNEGYIPLHFTNREIKQMLDKKLIK